MKDQAFKYFALNATVMLDEWRIVTWVGDIVFWFGIPVLMFFLHKYKLTEKLIFGLVANTALNGMIKLVVLAPRAEGFGPAFPSFHAQTAFLVAMFMSEKYPKLAGILFLLAGLVGISRVQLGLHTPIDVLVGAVLGILVAYYIYNTKMRNLDLTEVRRQMLHLAGIALVPIALVVPQQNLALSLVAVAGIIWLSSKSKGRIKRATSWFKRAGETSYREAVIFVLMLAAMLYFFEWRIAAAAIIALCVGDAVATLYGKHMGHIKLPWNKLKTLEGSVVGFMAVYIPLFYILGRELGLVVAFLAVAIESLPRVNDNIAIPTAVAVVLSLLI